jgi:anti-sigma regulatory factor (Ser/Thr protein kinase)
MPSVSSGRSLVTDARHWVSHTIRGAGAPPTDDTTAALVTSELVTNALMHASHPVEVAIDVAPDRTRIEVWDASPRATARVRDPVAAVGDVGGWGLAIVKRLSDDWGVCRAADRKYVWAEFRDGDSNGRRGRLEQVDEPGQS